MRIFPFFLFPQLGKQSTFIHLRNFNPDRDSNLLHSYIYTEPYLSSFANEKHKYIMYHHRSNQSWGFYKVANQDLICIYDQSSIRYYRIHKVAYQHLICIQFVLQNLLPPVTPQLPSQFCQLINIQSNPQQIYKST